MMKQQKVVFVAKTKLKAMETYRNKYFFFLSYFFFLDCFFKTRFLYGTLAVLELAL